MPKERKKPTKCWPEIRVTRLGELFNLGRLLKITKVAKILGYFFPTEKATYVLILTENGFGYI
jgi:hypothetical protein